MTISFGSRSNPVDCGTAIFFSFDPVWRPAIRHLARQQIETCYTSYVGVPLLSHDSCIRFHSLPFLVCIYYIFTKSPLLIYRFRLAFSFHFALPSYIVDHLKSFLGHRRNFETSHRPSNPFQRLSGQYTRTRAMSMPTPLANATIGNSLPPISNTDTSTQSQPQNPRALIRTAIETSNPALVNQALSINTARTTNRQANSASSQQQQLLKWALAQAVKAGNPKIVACLVDEHNAPIESITPSSLGRAAHTLLSESEPQSQSQPQPQVVFANESKVQSNKQVEEGSNQPTAPLDRFKQIITILRTHGWDIDQIELSPGADTSSGSDDENFINNEEHRTCLLTELTFNEDLVHYCIEHQGAETTAKSGAPGPGPGPGPGFLYKVAARGNVSLFRYLYEERHAVLGRRVLHKAVEGAAYRISEKGMNDTSLTSDSTSVSTAFPSAALGEIAMVDYLLTINTSPENTTNNKGDAIDINAMDIPPGTPPVPNFWGTPLCYGIHAGGKGAAVVTKYLLNKGADPYIKDGWENFDAFGLAERGGSKIAVEVLKEWKRQRSGEKPY